MMTTAPRNEDLFLTVPDYDGDRDPLDRYYTPEWVTEAFIDRLGHLVSGIVLEPCAGADYMGGVLEQAGHDVYRSDVAPAVDDWENDPRWQKLDFLEFEPDTPYFQLADLERDRPKQLAPDWTITNPPYRVDGLKPSDFVRHALDVSRRGVAMLLWQSFLEGCQDRIDIHRDSPPSHILWMPRFNYIVPGRKDDGPEMMPGWFVWDFGRMAGDYSTQMIWAGPEIRP